MFRKLIDDEIERVKAASQAGMLGKKVYERFEGALNSVADEVTESTVTSFISAELKDENPFAMIPGLVTKEERERAVSAIERKIADGIIVLLLSLNLKYMKNIKGYLVPGQIFVPILPKDICTAIAPELRG